MVRSRRSPSVFIVGRGRLGRLLLRELRGARIPVVGTCGRPGARGYPRALERADVILLCVPDRAVEGATALLAAQGRLHRGQVVAHCAGALDLGVLAAAQEAGAVPGSLHPLVSASGAHARLHGIAAAVDGPPYARRLLTALARRLGLVPLHVPAASRVRYHAAASLTANGLVSLVDLAVALLIDAGVPRANALPALLPLVRSAVEGLERAGLPEALTGPVARGDAAVVARHLAAVEGTAARDAYTALAARAVELARAQGRADRAGLDAIARDLSRRSRPSPAGRARARG